jgi:hypothetical protein
MDLSIKMRFIISKLKLLKFIMKYTRLTKEQFEELTQEFSTFLATQTIDKAEWDTIKAEKEVAEQELDVFSDLVWEGVLTRAEYLEHFSKNHIFSRVLIHMYSLLS